MIQDQIQSLIPDGWFLSNLINLDPGWQANLSNGEFVVIGSGEMIDDALAMAGYKTDDPSQYAGRLFHLPRLHEPDNGDGLSLLARLGLNKPRNPIARRV